MYTPSLRLSGEADGHGTPVQLAGFIAPGWNRFSGSVCAALCFPSIHAFPETGAVTPSLFDIARPAIRFESTIRPAFLAASLRSASTASQSWIGQIYRLWMM